MDKDTVKAWERPWTTDEIREHSANWNLAGDSGLLNHLQQFSQNLLAKTHATEVALDKLVEDLKTTSTSVQNATNTFLFLANTQFVENRVYDDDEKETPPEEKKDEMNPPKSKEEQEAEVFQNVKEALHMGLALLDTHFEAVEVPASDSEEEESSTSVGRLVLKPKNPYLSRPLPYLIGSKEFMEDDKVGLGEMSSDTEESPDQNVVQSSESDDEMEQDEFVVSPKRPAALSLSDTENSEPESDRSETLTKQKKPRTGSSVGVLGEEEEERDMFGQESPPEADEVAVVKGGMKNAFSDELSSKLTAAKSHSLGDKEHKKDNMFVPSSEPEDETGLFGKASHSFGERQGLFDDLDDWQNTSNSLWKNESTSTSKPVTNLPKGLQVNKTVDTSHVSVNQVDDIFTSSKQKLNVPTNIDQEGKMKESTPKSFLSTEPVEDVLFGPVEEADDLFTKKSKVTGTASGNSALFGKEDMDDDDDLFAAPSNSQHGSSQNITKKKKLPGAVPVLGDMDLFGNLSPVQQNSAEENNAVGRNLVSNVSDLPEESSSGIGRTKDTVSKPDEDSESQGVGKEPGKSSLFDSQKLFQSAITSTKIADGANKSSLFNTEIDSDSLFDKQRHSDEGILNRNISGSKISTSSLKPKAKKTVSLFDDSDSGDDELLFSSTSSTSSRSRRSQGSGDFLGGAVERRILPKKGLFEDNLMFGAVSKDDPDVDIFSSQNDSKSKCDPVVKDNIFNGNDVIGDSSVSGKKVTSNIFDNIDDVDDIFAVPKIATEKAHAHVGNYPQASLGKLSLFTDDSGDIQDIFSKEVNERKRHEEFVSEPLQAPSQSLMSENLSTRNSSGLITGNATSLFSNESETPTSVVKDNLERKNEVSRTTKPRISQKPKVPIKPPTSTVSVQGNLNSLLTSSGPKTESSVNVSQNISISDDKSQDVEKITNVSANGNEPQSVDANEGGKIGDNQTSIACIKPEPPRTLNIRKTTDIVFGSPSNEDDLFESSWSDKSSVGKENINNEQPKNNSFNSGNFSKILEGFNTHSAISDSISSKSREHSSNNSPESYKEKISSVVVGTNSSVVRDQQKTISSPNKLLIDPTTLLPGAKPPSMTIISDGAVGFDKPAETTSTLHSAGKERVKIQVKRRPQTRRARQEALRASSVEYDNIDAALISQISNSISDHVGNSVVSSGASYTSPLNTTAPKVLEPDNEPLLTENTVNNVTEKYMKSNFEGQLLVTELLQPKNDAYKTGLSDCLGGSSNALSPLTDEEDLFAVPHELPFDESSNKEMSNDGKSLFGGAPVLSPMDVRTRSDSFSSESIEANEERREGKDDGDLQYSQGNSRQNDIFNEGSLASVVPSSSATATDKSISNNVSAVSKTNDVFGRKWHDKDLVNESRGLFDDHHDDDNGNDGSDDDLFSTVRKPVKSGKKAEKSIFPEITSQRSPLFSPDDDNTPENLQSKQSFSSVTEVETFQKDSKVLSPPNSSENFTRNQRGSDTSSELFPDSISNFSQKKESDDLFSSNVSSKDLKTGSSVKNTEKAVTSQERVKPRVESLFGDDSIESDDLFGSSSVPKMSKSGSSKNLISGPKPKDPKGILFDDGDDDIFTVGVNKNRGPRNDTPFSKEEITSQRADADADELFSKRSSSSSRNQGTKTSSAQKVQSFEDPLMMFNK